MDQPELVAQPDAVSAEWLGRVLTHAGLLPAGRVTGFTAREVGTGQVGQNVRFALELEGAGAETPRSVVAKFPSPDPVSRGTGVAQGNYMREVRFYAELVHTVDICTPRCLFGEFDPATSDFVLVMEDLAPAQQGDQIEGCSVDQAALALSELAALHAPRWGDPSLASLDWVTRREPASGQLTQMLYQAVWPGFVERYAERLAPDSLAMAERFGSRVGAWMNAPDGPRTVTHGDYRLDNMLFGTAEGGHPLAVVDWQTPGHGFPVGDASYLLGASLLTEDRRKHEEALLRDYHRALQARGVSGFSWDQCWHDYRFFAFAGILMAVAASMIVGQSERGDDMFMAMASRHAAHAQDLDAESLL